MSFDFTGITFLKMLLMICFDDFCLLKICILKPALNYCKILIQQSNGYFILFEIKK